MSNFFKTIGAWLAGLFTAKNLNKAETVIVDAASVAAAAQAKNVPAAAVAGIKLASDFVPVTVALPSAVTSIPAATPGAAK